MARPDPTREISKPFDPARPARLKKNLPPIPKKATYRRREDQGRLGVRRDRKQDEDSDEHEKRRHEDDKGPHLLVALEGQEPLLRQRRHVGSKQRLGVVDHNLSLVGVRGGGASLVGLKGGWEGL